MRRPIARSVLWIIGGVIALLLLHTLFSQQDGGVNTGPSRVTDLFDASLKLAPCPQEYAASVRKAEAWLRLHRFPKHPVLDKLTCQTLLVSWENQRRRPAQFRCVSLSLL